MCLVFEIVDVGYLVGVGVFLFVFVGDFLYGFLVVVGEVIDVEDVVEVIEFVLYDVCVLFVDVD